MVLVNHYLDLGHWPDRCIDAELTLIKEESGSVRWLSALATKPHDLSLIPVAVVLEEIMTPSSHPLTNPPHEICGVCV